jgi:hypothetical protein
MIKFLIQFCINFFKSMPQLQLEIILLRKQLVTVNSVIYLSKAYRLPEQNGYVERVIGSIRREFLDHSIIINEIYLKKLLKAYCHYYNNHLTHLGLRKDLPESRPNQVIGNFDKISVTNELNNYYFSKAA